jgi:flagellar biosynthetic protein FlhB
MKRAFTAIARPGFDIHTMMEIGSASFVTLSKVLLPILIAGFLAALVIGFLQVGPLFSMEALEFKPEKLNPIEGMKNMFKVVTLIELVKNIAKISVVLYIAYLTIKKFLREILLAAQVNLIDSASLTGGIISSFFIKVSMVFLVVAVIDLAVQRWNYMKNMRMSKDEVKREYKQDEGDPHIKSERRHLHREMVFGDARKNVKKSDAVVSNPIHVAVAIQYDREEMAAPEVVAKGQRKYAEMILQIAREENIPIIRNIPLAWSLLKVEEGMGIPEDLYEPVAEVLSLVYEMKERGNLPKIPAATAAQSPQPASESVRQPGGFNPLG